jgi:hypothetical protein
MNNVTIQPCKFENVRTGEVTYGIRIYDGNGCSYDNTWDAIPDDDLEVLQLVRENQDGQTEAMLDFLQERQQGCHIGDEWYEWEQIKPCFED